MVQQCNILHVFLRNALEEIRPLNIHDMFSFMNKNYLVTVTDLKVKYLFILSYSFVLGRTLLSSGPVSALMIRSISYFGHL